MYNSIQKKLRIKSATTEIVMCGAQNSQMLCACILAVFRFAICVILFGTEYFCYFLVSCRSPIMKRGFLLWSGLTPTRK